MKKIISILTVVTLTFGIIGCNGGTENTNDNENSDISQGFDEQKFFESIDQSNITAINEIVEGFGSPVEMGALMKDKNIPFSKDYLIKTKVVDNYTTNFKKALGFGILSADLGYLNVYEKSPIDYLLAINGLAEDLNVSQFFDFQTLKRLVTSSDNMDSLMFLTVNSYHQIDAYFRQTKRSHLSVLSVTGVWIESLYLITQVANDNEYENFDNQIGSQKELLTKLIEIMETYEGHPQFDKILKEFRTLEQAFSGVKIEVKETEGKIEVTGDIVVIYPDEETIITVSDADLKKIITATEKARNTIINL